MGRISFGQETRRRVVSALANLRPFQSSKFSALDHSLVGISGPYRRLTNAKYGALPREYAVGLDDAVYVVYCYGTPIAWVTMADEATEDGRVNYVPDWQYSATTTFHQSVIIDAWGSNKIVDPNPAKSKRDNHGTARGRRSDAVYGRLTAEQEAVRREARENRPVSFRTAFRDDAARFRTNHRGVRYDSAVERDTSFERDMAEARENPAPTDGAAHMDGRNVSERAELRDLDRVESDIERVLRQNSRWFPAHP